MGPRHSKPDKGIQEAAKQWNVEFHDEFVPEFRNFSESIRRRIYLLAELLQSFGPQLGRPHVDTLKGSKYLNMKELRFYAEDGAWRLAFAFDSERNAILLVAGDKAGISQAKFYRSLIRIADGRFEKHLETNKKKGD